MKAINKGILIEGMSKNELASMIETIVESKVSAIKIPDPSAEKFYKAKEFDEYFSISRSKGQNSRKKLIARGLIRPVEISPGVFRYRRSELLALNYNDLK